MARAVRHDPVGLGFVELGNADTLNVGNIQLLTGVSADAILDDDNLSPDSPSAIPTQHSVKHYIDSRLYLATQSVDSGNGLVDSFDDTVATGCVWHYSLKFSGNIRTGTIMAAWDTATNVVVYTETSTGDIGNTSAVVFSVSINPTDEVVLTATITDANIWDVVVSRMSL